MAPGSNDQRDNDSTPSAPRSGSDRREFLGQIAGAYLGAGALAGGLLPGGTATAEEAAAGEEARRLIVRSLRPLNLESPPASLDSFLTPNDEFFVRSHHGAPTVNAETWEISVDGLVDRPLTWSIKDLESMEPATLGGVLQCAGNGRSKFSPTIPGLLWDRGAVGHAEWTGVPLGRLLEEAGVKPEAAHVHLIGGDVTPTPKTPAFVRSIPVDRALSPDTLIAFKMNGEPMPTLHGGPMRVVIPGWTGNNWTKWIRKLVVSTEEAPGVYMRSGYRMPRTPVPPGVDPDPEDMVPVTWMNVKSLITSPGLDAELTRGPTEIRGVAWTGEGHVVKVEVSTGAGPDAEWREAELLDKPRQGSWRRFKIAWEPPAPGKYVLRARATDSEGQIQPETYPWNKSGYLWNAYDQVACQVS